MMKKTRKQRVVKGRYVDIDSVDVEPGDDYLNWIAITKHKLKERESKLLQIKINTTETVINEAISDYNPSTPTMTTFRVTEKTRQETLKHLYDKIDEWNGVNTSRTKSSLTTYRDYFTVSKKWFDSAKKKQIGKVYWLLIFHQIKQLAITSEIQLHIIKALFQGTIKYNNTKTQSLISGGSIMCSEELQQFLYNLHPTLKIKEWIKEQKMCRSYQQNSSKLIYKLQSQLNTIIQNKNINLNVNHNVSNCNTNNNQVSITSANVVAYGGVHHHNVSNSVSGVRWTPFVGNNTNQIQNQQATLPLMPHFTNMPHITIPLTNNNVINSIPNNIPIANNLTIPSNNNTYAIIFNQNGANPQIFFV